MLTKKLLPPLNDSEVIELNAILSQPVMRRWFELIEQEILLEGIELGDQLTVPAEVIKASQAKYIGKLEVSAMLGKVLAEVEAKQTRKD